MSNVPQKTMATKIADAKGINARYTKDGALIEGVAIGGDVLVVSKDVQWRRDIFPYFSSSFTLLFAHMIYTFTGNLMLPIWLMYVVVPLNGLMGPGDNTNISDKCQAAWANDKRFLLPLYCYTFLETISWIWALTVMSDVVNPQYTWFLNAKPETWSQYLNFTFTFGFFAGLSGVIGHGLVHKRESHNKYLGNFGYTKFFYSHFLDEHIKSHHKVVATPEDSTTASKNQSIFSFFAQSVIGSHVTVWKMETKRIQKLMGDDVELPLIIFNNKMTHYFALHATMVFTIYMIFGWQSVKFQFMYAGTGIMFLESINYIEHYGLLRKQDADGVYESINKMHSWNSKSGPVLIRLQRHSDHHAHKFRPYQILRRFDEAPTLPFEYLHSMFLCAVPPLWFYLVNPRVDALRQVAQGDKNVKTKYNQHMPMTKEDRTRQNVGWVALFIFQIFLTYMTFY